MKEHISLTDTITNTSIAWLYLSPLLLANLILNHVILLLFWNFLYETILKLSSLSRNRKSILPILFMYKHPILNAEQKVIKHTLKANLTVIDF